VSGPAMSCSHVCHRRADILSASVQTVARAFENSASV